MPELHVQIGALPSEDMRSMCLWLLKLSRAAKPLHRLMAVDLAAGLLATLPGPWTPEAGYKVGGTIRNIWCYIPSGHSFAVVIVC